MNDNVDTLKKATGSERIIIPFKNLMNEAYIRDISDKTTSHLQSKCREGQFIGAFAPYGYRKDPLNHNRLLVDEEAAKVVKMIFDMKLQGFSPQFIADTLNNQKILSPMEYKKDIAERYNTPFKIRTYTIWTATAVARVLKNEIYTGTLVQGKTGKINFKISRRTPKSQDTWIRVENTHKAIVSDHIFHVVNELMNQDTRQSPIRKGLYVFSGLLYCADCNNSMVRKTVTSKGRKYFYYVCSHNKTNKNECSSHRIKETSLFAAVLHAVNTHAASVVETAKILETIDNAPIYRLDVQRLEQGIAHNSNEIEKYQKRLSRLHEDLQDNLITDDEYSQFKSGFNAKIVRYKKENDMLQNEMETIHHNGFQEKSWIALFKDKADCTQLDRVTAIHLIDKILVHEKSKIEIFFKYQSEFNTVSAYVQNISREAL